MSYSDFTTAVNTRRETSSGDIIFGDAELAKGPVPKIESVSVKYYIANMDRPDHVEEAERIFTTSLRCANELNKPGDISVFKEETNFSKTGEYIVVIKYAEFKELDKKEPVTTPVKEAPCQIPDI